MTRTNVDEHTSANLKTEFLTSGFAKTESDCMIIKMSQVCFAEQKGSWFDISYRSIKISMSVQQI